MENIIRILDEDGNWKLASLYPGCLRFRMLAGRVPGFFMVDDGISVGDIVKIYSIVSSGAVCRIAEVERLSMVKVSLRTEGDAKMYSIDFNGTYLGDISCFEDGDCTTTISSFFFYWLGMSMRDLTLWFDMFRVPLGESKALVFASWDKYSFMD